MKKIMIIGARGMFGTAMEEACLERKIEVLGTSSDDFDITDKLKVEKAVKDFLPDVVVNSAVFMGIPACEENPHRSLEVNAVAAINLAHICKNAGIKLVQTSTNSLFDGKKGAPYTEEDIPNPQNIYGLSKFAGEIGVRNILTESYIVRFPKLFGKRRNKTSGFTDKILEKMRRGEELRIVGDRVDTFTYSLHAARALLNILEENREFGIYHIANKGVASYYDFTLELAKKIGFTGKIVCVTERKEGIKIINPLRVDLQSVKINPLPSWQQALDEYVKHDKINM